MEYIYTHVSTHVIVYHFVGADISLTVVRGAHTIWWWARDESTCVMIPE